MNAKKTIIFFLVFFCNVSAVPSEDYPSKLISHDLSVLARQYTGRFLKKRYSKNDVDAFISFIHQNKIEAAFYIYTFENKKWIAKAIVEKRKNSFPHNRFAGELLNVLNVHVTSNINEGTSFIYMPQEPLHECGTLTPEQQHELNNLFEKCPMLLTCTHPSILWSEKAVLIPDPYILHKNYPSRIKEIQKKVTIPFRSRKPIIFFRGGVTGPYSLYYTMESIENDDRIKLFLLSKQKSFINAGITDDSILDTGRVTPDFKEWFEQNLVSKKGDVVDFVGHAQHKYLISLDGFGAAWSRVPYILFTGSLLLLRAECNQYFYPLLKNGETHVNVDRGLETIEDTYQYLENNPKTAQLIADNGRVFAEKYLKPEALNMYLSHVIHDLSAAFKASV